MIRFWKILKNWMSKRIWKSLVGGLMISKDVTVAHCVLPVHIVHMPPMHIGHMGGCMNWDWNISKTRSALTHNSTILRMRPMRKMDRNILSCDVLWWSFQTGGAEGKRWENLCWLTNTEKRFGQFPEILNLGSWTANISSQSTLGQQL